ncbi:MAG TPA: hypothetical protein PK875_14085 [Spirochaetota bacterium]|mgnify:CR=1 FL=1|nr:hypothetical protein [Spirochaetota bacterium]
MTKATMDAKVCSIKPHPKDEGKSAPEKNIKSQKVRGDTYTKGEEDAYRAIVTGKSMKAESYPINEMINSMYEAENPDYRDPVQEYLSGFLCGLDGAEPEPADEIGVPLFNDLKMTCEDIETNTKVAEEFATRYKDLEHSILGMILNAKRSLKAKNASNMTPVEIKAIRDGIARWEKNLAKCRIEGAKAKLMVAESKENVLKEAEKAKELGNKLWYEDEW